LIVYALEVNNSNLVKINNTVGLIQNKI
jgi:hypothetical protein